MLGILTNLATKFRVALAVKVWTRILKVTRYQSWRDAFGVAEFVRIPTVEGFGVRNFWQIPLLHLPREPHKKSRREQSARDGLW